MIEERTNTVKNLTRNAAFMYCLALFFFPFVQNEATKFINPEDTPMSLTEAIMTIRFAAAEKIPNSATLKALAIRRVNKKPRKAEARFPTKRM